ncbi:MAG TPA: dTDP-4-dehydrorhamnose reductase [Lachnospiraceae bacterium]|nr:dTDP-4-dehydrorhamnose reductase [Lachnospiraceae bacterium]
MKKLLITGCNGQLGRAINRVYEGSTDYELINTDFGIDGVRSLDITDLGKVKELVDEVRPYAIINCAAFTAVDACEVQRDTAMRINAIGPRNLSIAAEGFGAKLIHVSTDYVFSGDGDKPYTEFDKTGPVTMYGISKLAGEDFVREFAGKYFIVRTAWLYGDGKNFVRTMLKLSETHKEITVVDDQVGSPTSALELARAIKCLVPTDNYGLFHGTCEGFCSWADFAKEIFRLSAKDTRVIPVTSEEYKILNPASADRPKYSVLENSMFKLTTDHMFKDWRTAISEYMPQV